MENKGFIGIYEFGEYRLDARNRLLWAGAKQIPLTPKEFDVLLFLVENAGQVVTKDCLLEAVWRDAFVEESTLARNVSWLRKKLAEHGAASENLIQTVPKRGYRFAAPITVSHDAPVFIEKRIVTEIVIEESIAFDEQINGFSAAPPEPAANTAAAAPVSVKKAPPRRVAAVAAFARDRNGKPLRWAVGLLFAVAALGGAIFYWRLFAAPTVIKLKNAAPFSGLPGRENMPSFATDNSRVAFVWNGGEGNNFDVYVKQINQGEPLKLTATTDADEINPIFTGDNSNIVFARRLGEKCGIFMIPAFGGAERKIAEVETDYTGLSFSPDNRWLAVSDRADRFNRAAIFLIEMSSGAKRQITAPPEGAKDDAAKFSPDGKRIAFLRRFNDYYDELMIQPISDGGAQQQQQLTFDKKDITGLGWRADNRTIVFGKRETDQTANLWQISDTGGTAQIVVGTGKSIVNPAISADGRKIIYADQLFETDIWRFEKNQPPTRFVQTALDDYSPDISPDNTRVAFVSSRTGKTEIWTVDASGKNPRQVTGVVNPASPDNNSNFAADTRAGSPRFSPDNKQLAFDAPVNDNPEIFTIAVDGSHAPKRLTFGAGRSFLPSWSRDGNWIYFCSDRAGGLNLWRMPSAGGEAIQITRSGGFESFPAPDGKTIFYTKGGDEAGVWQISVEGADERLIPELSSAATRRYLAVTPAGIYFVAQDPLNIYGIKFYDSSSRKISEVLKTDKVPIWTYSGMSVSSDAKTILYTNYAQSQTGIVVADF